MNTRYDYLDGFYELTSSKDDGDFKIACSEVLSCSRAPKPSVTMPAGLWHGMVALCENLSTEWLAYLQGTLEDDGAKIDDIYFPPQSPGGAHVEPLPNPEILPSTIGCIHSHVKMAAKFSSVDRDHANWPLEIVVNARGEYEATLRSKLPCGEFMRADAKILTLSADYQHLSQIASEAIKIGKQMEQEISSKAAAERWQTSEDKDKALVTLNSEWKSGEWRAWREKFMKGNPSKRPSDDGMKKCRVHGCKNRVFGKGICHACLEEFGTPSLVEGNV